MEPSPGKQKSCDSYGVQVKLEIQKSCKTTELCEHIKPCFAYSMMVCFSFYCINLLALE